MNPYSVVKFVKWPVDDEKMRYSNPEPRPDTDRGISVEKPARPYVSSPLVDADPAFPETLNFDASCVVHVLRQSRVGSCNAVAIMSALFVGMEALMLYILKTSQDLNPENANIIKLQLALSYAGLIFNASTTFTALLLIDRFGNLGVDSLDVLAHRK
ncbi:hypothetical protein FRB96_005113 [Tulasnella sp. 330]|nr:hypothetical protein FRB96_005113 [Tulasnella sp. 330]KAG8881485.1 hypothetical protein FRB97_009539 [Tulasnella sp. 331]